MLGVLIKIKKYYTVQTGPVRFMFPVLLSVLALLGATASAPDSISYIELVPSTTTVMTGDTFTIDIYANAHVPVNALDVTVRFLSGTVEVLGIDKGQSVLTIWTKEPTVSNTDITFSGGTYRRGFVGRHLVATIEAKALKTGKTEFLVTNAELLAGDGQGTKVSVVLDADKAKQSFIIYDQDTAPESIGAELGLLISEDIDGDGEVTLKDVSSFMAVWYTKESLYDFNNDKKMNFIDFSIILAKSFRP